MNLSKNKLKLITSLHQKKYRTIHNLFVADGTKVVGEYLNSKFELNHLYCVDDTAYKNIEEVTRISEGDLKKISSFVTPNNVLGIFEIPQEDEFKDEGLILVLDQINDPGNLGTIIRLCDWFGVDQLICSVNTVDCYNSKVIQASMGSLARVSVLYTDLNLYLKESKLPKFAATINGSNVYEYPLPKNAVLVLGSEANGIGDGVLKLLDYTISIPRFGKVQKTESLNVATATAILLSEFKRSV